MMPTEDKKQPGSYGSYGEYLNHFYGRIPDQQTGKSKLELFFGEKLVQRVLEIEVAERFHTTINRSTK